MPSSVYNFYTFQMHIFQMCTWLCLRGAWCFMHNITGTQLLQQWDVQHNLSKHSKQDIRNHLQYLVTVIFGKLLCISNMKKQLMLQGGESQNCYGTLWYVTLGVLWFACFFFFFIQILLLHLWHQWIFRLTQCIALLWHIPQTSVPLSKDWKADFTGQTQFSVLL